MWWCGGGGGVGYTFLVLSLTMAMEDPTDKQTVNQSNTVSQLSVHTQPTDTRTEQQPISLADVLHSPDSPTSFMQPTDTLDGTGYQNISATDTHTDSKEQPTHEVIAQDLKVFQTRHAGLKQTSKTLSMAKDTLIKARQGMSRPSRIQRRIRKL
eukprot:GHVQ01032363.1.p4 GENE.GHVQ01032363.1~~GHVQ01032363.1.p4  ORF type:complete len:154 (-),score=33.70 GHVQ01032363.1:2435-2896(-)